MTAPAYHDAFSRLVPVTWLAIASARDRVARDARQRRDSPDERNAEPAMRRDRRRSDGMARISNVAAVKLPTIIANPVAGDDARCVESPQDDAVVARIRGLDNTTLRRGDESDCAARSTQRVRTRR
jgi:hypothetical protein